MSSIKSLAYAVFFIFLCIAPIFSFAQDGTVGRLIDVPNVEHDNGKLSMTKSIRDALSNAGHIIFTEEEMRAAATSNGFPEKYWDSEKNIAKLNEKVRHDALVHMAYEKGKRKSSIVIKVYNAYTGEMMAELERSLKKKGKLTKDDTKAIVRGVNQVTANIEPIEYKDEVTITIISTPSGATVLRDGVNLGTTPFETTLPAVSGASEQWVISYPDREPVTQLISLEKSDNYDVNIPIPLETANRIGKVKGSTGRPVFLIGFNASPTIRKLDSDAEYGDPTHYKTGVFGMYSFDIDFFPFGLASTNQYLAGLGVSTSIGFGFLDTNLASADDASHACTRNGNTISCTTKYIRFNFDLVYRLLLQKKDGKLNPDGLALDFIAGFNLARFNIDSNPTYVGHDYNGVKLGVRFSTPVGIKKLRYSINFNFDINAGQGNLEKLSKWGSIIESSWGINLNTFFTYDIWKGIFARVGYSFTMMKDDFGGVGCLDSNCLVPRNATSTDYYHEIMLGLGYMLY